MSDQVIPDEPRDPSIEHLLEVFRQTAFDSVRVGLPGLITEYDKTQQRASVQPLIQHGYVLDGVRRVETLPIVHDVPVHFPGAGTARITFPVRIGTLGWLKFASSSLDVWLVRGGLVDPDDDRRHDINDAVFEPGLHSFASVPTDQPDDATVMWAGDFDVCIGAYAGAEKTIKGETFNAAMNTFLTKLTAYVNAIQGTVDPTHAATTAIVNAIVALSDALDDALATKAKVV